MTPESEPADDGFADQLVALDEALAAGKSQPFPADSPLNSDSGEKLAKSPSKCCGGCMRPAREPQTRPS